MTPQEMRDRTDRFSVAVIQFCRRKIPCDVLLLRILTQLQDAATSVASNYHAACRAQSRAQFVAKLSISVEEADECAGWLQKLDAAGLGVVSGAVAPKERSSRTDGDSVRLPEDSCRKAGQALKCRMTD